LSTSTFETIAGVLTEQFHVEPQRVRADASLSSLGLDSLALVEFVFALEDRFGLRIPEDQLDPRRSDLTLASVCQAVDAALAQRQDSAPTAG